MKTRSMHLAGLIAAISLVIAACGSGQSSPAASAPASSAPVASSETTAPASSQPPAAKVTFTLTTWVGEDEGKELQTLVLDKINASQSEFEIVHQPAPADYYTKLQTGLAGGTAADFAWLSQEYIAGYASKGALLDLTDLLKNVDNPAADVSKYFPDVVKTAEYQGKVYGLPWIAQPVLLYYNPKGLFDAAGIAYPDDTWTWDKLTSTAKALTKGDQYGLTANGWPPVHMFIWQAGGEVITPDLASSPVDSPEAIKGEEFYKSLIFNKACCPTEDTIAAEGFDTMFKAGKVAMFFGGASDNYADAEPATPSTSGPRSSPRAPHHDDLRGTRRRCERQGANVKGNEQLAAKALAMLTEGIFHWKLIAPHKDYATADVIKAAIPDKWKPQKEQQIDTILAATQDMALVQHHPSPPGVG